MSSTIEDTIKNAILSEIEEGQITPRPPRIQDEVLSICSDRDFKLSSDALQRAILHGIDPRFCRYQWLAKKISPQQSKKPKNVDESIIEDQFDTLLSRLDIFEEEWISGEEDSDMTAKERVLATKLSKNAFDPLMTALKENRPILHRALTQHSLISGRQRVKRKQSKRSRKKEKREREREEREGKESSSDDTRNNKSSGISSSSSNNNEALPVWELYRQSLAMIVAKSIAEGSLQAQLVAVALLLQVHRDHEASPVPPSSSSSSSSNKEELTIPIGNVLGAVFERPDGDDTAEDPLAAPTAAVKSPFHYCLQHFPRDGSTTGKCISFVDLISGEIGSQGTLEEGQGTEDTTSQHGTLISEEAGSTVGSSTMAEQGTETASLQDAGEGELEEDLTEEELLAQAMALSMGSQAATGADIAPTSTSPSQSVSSRRDGSGATGPGLAMSVSLSQSALSRVSFSRAPIRTQQMAGSVTSSGCGDIRSQIPLPEIPDKFPFIPPMATFGPFGDLRFWQMLHSTEGFAGQSPSNTPLTHVILSLLISVCASADESLGECSAPSVEGDVDDEGVYRRDGKTPRSKHLPLYGTTAVAPHTVTFLLLELLLDMLMTDLKKMSENAFSGLGDLLKNVDNEDYLMDSSNPPTSFTNEVEGVKWNFYRYFLVWSIISVLKTIRAHLAALEASKISPCSLGLGLGLADDSAAEATPSVSFAMQLLQRVSECMGPETAPIRCEPSMDAALAGLGVQKLRLAPGYGSVNPLHSDKMYRHALRIAGIDTYVAGLCVFHPTVAQRERELSRLLARTALPTSTEHQFGSNLLLPFLGAASVTRESLDADLLLPRSLETYRLYMLQKICLAVSDGDLVSRNLRQTAASSAHIGLTFSAVTDQVSAEPSPSGSKIPNLPRIPSFLEFRDQKLGIESLNANYGLSDPESVSFHKYSVGESNVSLESALLSRLGHNDLMLTFPQSSRTSMSETAFANSCAFWGELSLLRHLQQKHMQSLTGGNLESNSSSCDLTFNPRKCNQNLIISNNGQTVTQKNIKSWGTVLSTRGFESDSGLHEWSIRLDKCDKGDIFIGVCMLEAFSDTYVGGDRYGWGMIGTRSLWHNQSKVRSEYGSSFNTLSVVTVTLDTNCGQLSYAADGVSWGVAFDSLPRDVVLYPAVSLYYRDDQVTAVSPVSASASMGGMLDIRRKKSTSENADSLRTTDRDMSMKTEVLSCYYPFLNYARALCGTVNGILRAAEAMDDDGRRRAALAHPFIGLLLPSLTASIVSYRLSLHATSLLSIHLLPLMMVLTKRLSALHERHGRLLPGIHSDERGIIGNTTGLWLIKSSAAGNNIPAQEYLLEFCVVEPDAGASDDTEACESTVLKPVKVYGKGLGAEPSVTARGTVIGTRIKFQETWAIGTHCDVEGRLALDGNHFTGLFKDTKTSTTGCLEGIKVSSKQKYNSVNNLLKAALLCSMAFGKLAAQLVVGVEPISLGIPDLGMPLRLNAAGAGTEESPNGATAEDDEEEKTREDPDVDADVDVDNTDIRTGEAKGGVGGDSVAATDSTKDASATLRAALLNWANSQVLSGGLPLLPNFLSEIRAEMDCYVMDTLSSQSTTANVTIATATQVQDQLLHAWWLSDVFSMLYGKTYSGSVVKNSSAPQTAYAATASSDTAGYGESVASVPAFLAEVINAKGRGKKLDDYVLHHVGLTAMSKIGGEPMQAARRSVLSSLIYLSGSLALCEAAVESLLEKKRGEDDRPHEWLMELWRAAQRVIDNAIWKKQQTGITYVNSAQVLVKKADFLLNVLPSETASAITAVLTTQKDVAVQPFGTEVHISFSKLLAEAVEFFLQTSLKMVDALRLEMAKATLRAISRTAGFKSFKALMSKLEDVPENLSRLPPLSLTLQAAAVEYILPALIGHVDIRDRINSPKSVPSDSLLLVSSSQSTSSVSGLDASVSGHYFDGLKGCSAPLVSTLRSSVEGVYILITQLLQRATWANDRDTQCVALSSWGLSVQPDDHVYLNQVGIFRVLQAVMEGVRSSMSSASVTSQEFSGKSDKSSTFSLELISNSNKRVAQLVLRIVHALASQVAFTKVPEKNSTSVVRMNRMLSGPETLSQALFDMLYSELHHGLRKIVLNVFAKGTGKSSKSVVEDVTSTYDGALEEFLDGELYVYRILRLLFSVSAAAVCQTYLLAPKWITLLLSAVGCGSLMVQRRLLRLLRRLLSSAAPDSCQAYVCSFFSERSVVMDSDTSMADEEAKLLMAEQGTQQDSHAGDVAERVVTLLLESISCLVPPSDEASGAAVLLLKQLHSEELQASLSAESISILRHLHEVVAWREPVSNALARALDVFDDKSPSDMEKWNQCSSLSMAAAAFGVLGGYVDRLRPGGLVLLRPFSLAGLSESFALRLAAAAHSCAMVLSRTPGSRTVEVVLMDRGRKTSRTTGGGAGLVQGPTQVGAPSVGSNSIASSTPAASIPPAKSVKMNEDDVLPTWDVPISPDYVPVSLFSKILGILDTKSLPWLIEQIDSRDFSDGGEADEDAEEHKHDGDRDGDPAGEGGSSVNDEDEKDEPDDGKEGHEAKPPLTNTEVLQVFVFTSSFRSTASLVQCDALVSALASSPHRFRDLLTLSTSESTSGGLGALEQIEQRWAALWEALAGLEYKKLSPADAGDDDNGGKSSGAMCLGDRRDSQKTAQVIASGIAARLDAAAASASMNILASLGAPIGIDPATARRHMMEMGFPKEWCDVALRRCRYNVEMAINLCFEHGTDMDQLVAEDAAIMAAQPSRSNPTSRRTPADVEASGRGEGDGSSGLSSSAGIGPARIFLGARSARGPMVDTAVLMKQLLEMGFPPSWCSRALDVNQNNVDAALTWILSHGDELVSDEDGEGDGEENEIDVPPSEEKREENTAFGPNPLTVVSGSANISSDLTCSMQHSSGFPSIGCRGFGVLKGKWYFETRLITAGCIQIGWADSMYEGNAENGQGCGDDAHSWAFDGWRLYLWHETFSEWGCKWVPGDVIGCAVDMDLHVMSFYLNGHGLEIGMGDAFVGFINCGSLYPCASFNHNEQIQFNFGSTPFKYPIPPGYSPYSDNVHAILKLSRERFQMATLDYWSDCIVHHSKPPEDENDGNVSNVHLEDALEEQRGETDFIWQRRYFTPDDNRSSHSVSPRLPIPNLPPTIPNEREEIVNMFVHTSLDLCVLYCRLIVLRAIAAYPRIPQAQRVILDQLLGLDESKDSSGIHRPLGEALFLLTRLCGASSSRTKVYLQTMSILSSSQPVPANIGSLLTVGGAPMLQAMQAPIAVLLGHARVVGDSYLLEALLHMVTVDTCRASKREFLTEWRLEGCFSPAIYRDGVLIDQNSVDQPSLQLAVWATILITDQLASEVVGASVEDDIWTYVIEWLDSLCKGWCTALRSPSMAVKQCAMRMLSILVQEVSTTGGKFVRAPPELLSAMLEEIPSRRLQTMVLWRISQERGSMPVVSEYLQTLMELVIAVRSATPNENSRLGYSNDPISTPDFPLSTLDGDDNVPNYNWESMDGLLLSDDGWDTWTGSVMEQNLNWTCKATDQSDKPQDQPPELLPGCRVARPKPPKPSDTAGPGDVGDDSAPAVAAGDVGDSPPVPLPPEGHDVPSRSSPRSMRLSKQQSRSNQLESELSLGTVLEVCSWPKCGPGTARSVRWDDDNSVEMVRWNAFGVFDVTHVQCNKQGKVITKHPKPVSVEARAARALFGMPRKFGVILRLRDCALRATDGPDILSRVDGVMEWPDFSAIVYVRGVRWKDGNWSITEEKLLSGPGHSDWTTRFGTPEWRRGTTYDFSTPRSQVDVNSGRGRVLSGQVSYKVMLGMQNVVVVGDIYLQKAHLFSFDEKACGRPIVISGDKLAVSCSGDRLDGRPCVFGTVGFSTGVHYWEYKIDQADLGSVFLGVAEKPPPSTSDGLSDRLKRWQGYGAVNIRLSYRSSSVGSNGKEAFYGDNFHTGDTVGVLLDMNRGRLSFFLDGMKYGQHTLADLGEASDGLIGLTVRSRPRTFFPIVGFRKVSDRSADRVVLTSRWLSCIGQFPSQTLQLVNRAWSLLSTWNCDRPHHTPLAKDMWVYRDAWRDWLRWRSGRFVKVRTRCKTPSLLVTLDTSPRACVEASICLGLHVALFRGDHVFFAKSCGKPLEAKEEAVILGAYEGQLFYRLDSQHGEGGLQEGSSTAWCLAAHDVESMTISRRAGGECALPEELVNVKLPRIPAFHGGRLRVVYDGGAVIRDGLEIDTSDVIGTVELNAEVYAVERRINSSNIPRYRVLFQGRFGWISENIRGGTEEPMVTRILAEDPIALADAKAEAAAAVETLGLGLRVEWDDVLSREVALQKWSDTVKTELHLENVLNPGTVNPATDTFSRFLELATTMDGHKHWSVEADMQLSELISRVAVRDGLSPQNLPSTHLAAAIGAAENSPSSLVKNVSVDHVLARASLLRVANQVIGHALPFLSTTTPEEKWRNDRLGVNDDVEVVPSQLQPPPDKLPPREESPLLQGATNGRGLEESWYPPCNARRLRSLRRVLFSHTKRMFWESILDATTTPTSLHQDEYEDPKDIKVIRVNRVRATHSRLASIANPTDRVRQSVFGQLHKEMRSWPSTAFRRSYLGKGHGGQKRAFKVKFTGEGVNDYGGPYRAVFEQVVDELQADSAVATSTSSRPWERCLLPLLYPCPNRLAGVGANQDKFVFSPSPPSPMTQELMQYFGKLVGTAVRHSQQLALDLSSLVWRPLVRLPCSRGHLETIDSLTASSLSKMEELGEQLEQEWAEGGSRNGVKVDGSFVPAEWAELTFAVSLSDAGIRVPLCVNGEETPVTLGNWREFVHLAERCRLRECMSMYKGFRDGLAAVLPMDLTPLFTALELEHLVSGTSKVDLRLLRQCTEYENIDMNSDLVRYFWEVLEEMSDEELTLFLRFVWARSRLPTSAQDLPMNFKLQGAQVGGAEASPDTYLPHAQTCFFSLSLPAYSSKDILRDKLLYAINNSPNMDADVRLHSAEGWADS